MTKRARELGLMKSTFANSKDWPDPGKQDDGPRAVRAGALHYPDYPEYHNCSATKEFTGQDPPAESQPAAERDGGADGLRPLHQGSGYGMVGSAVQNGTRLIVVVTRLKTPTTAPPKPRRCSNGAFVISSANSFAAGPALGYAGCSAAQPLVSCQPRAGQVMVQRTASRS